MKTEVILYKSVYEWRKKERKRERKKEREKERKKKRKKERRENISFLKQGAAVVVEKFAAFPYPQKESATLYPTFLCLL